MNVKIITKLYSGNQTINLDTYKPFEERTDSTIFKITEHCYIKYYNYDKNSKDSFDKAMSDIYDTIYYVVIMLKKWNQPVITSEVIEIFCCDYLKKAYELFKENNINYEKILFI